MNEHFRRRIARRALSLAGLLLIACAWHHNASQGISDTRTAEGSAARISRFGQYSGYSSERFSSWARHSQYLTVRDGTRLAADILRPAVSGVAVEEQLPVIWIHARYHRSPHLRTRYMAKLAAERTGAPPPSEDAFPPGIMSIADENPVIAHLLRHGYVIVSVAVRGSDASFGRYEGAFSQKETNDAYDVIDWLAKQPWSNGNVGMIGGSYMGVTQYMAASTHHPALKAIMPEVALLDMYDVLYPGGVYRQDFMERWGGLTRELDVQVRPLPVDDDGDGRLLEQAIKEHRENWDSIQEFRAAKLRDHDSARFAWARFGPTAVLDKILSSTTASYHYGGFYDAFGRDQFIWFKIYTGPTKLAVGPWPHTGYTAEVDAERLRISIAEHHRWFDYWLKGIDNGVMDGPRVNYAITDVPGVSWRWETADDWPPRNSQQRTFFLSGGPSGTVHSINDGLLAHEAPRSSHAEEYRVRLDTSTGVNTRWHNTVSFNHPMSYPDMTDNDMKSLTYTTLPLPADVTVVGNPTITLYASIVDAHDADFYALLEEVDVAGHSQYVSEGVLRASHRRSRSPPWGDDLGSPWHRSFASDLMLVKPGEVIELRFALLPVAHLFNRGHRLRITVMGADADNTEKPPSPGATVRVHLGGQYPSRVAFPVLDQGHE